MSTKPSRILVTGGTGYLGAHIVDLLLERGIVVVVTARSQSKATAFVEKRSKFKDLLKVVITGDLTAAGAFDDVVKDVDVMIHCASPLPNEVLPGSILSEVIIKPAIAGTVSILQAARKNPGLKRLVLTSSVAAVFDITRPDLPGGRGHHYTAQDWNPIKYEQGTKSDSPMIAYRAAKKFAELEAWATVYPESEHLKQLDLDPSYPRHASPSERGTTFDLTVLCPPFVFGPWVHPLTNLASVNDSIREFRNIVRGDYRDSHLPKAFSPFWADVREVALAHVEAALRLDRSENPSISNRRYTVCAPEKYSYHLVAEIMREEFPEWAEEVLPPREETPPFKNISMDGIRATEELGVEYRSFRECVVDLVRQLRAEVLREAEEDKL